MSTTYDAILGGKKGGKKGGYYPYNKKTVVDMSAPSREQVVGLLKDDDYQEPMTETQMRNASVLTDKQIQQRSGVDVRQPVTATTNTTPQAQVQQGAVSVVPTNNGAPTNTQINGVTPRQTTPQTNQGQVTTQQGQVQTPLEKYISGQRLTPQEQVELTVDDKEKALREKAGIDTPQGQTAEDEQKVEMPDGSIKTLDDALAALEEWKKSKLETKEQREAREKREKRERLWATIGDGLTAMHEAYSYGRGVKPMTNGGRASERVRAMQRLAEEKRDKDYKDYLTNYINIMQQKRLAEKDENMNKYRQGLLEIKGQQTEQQLRKLDAEIDRLIAQGKTEEARQKQMEAQTLLINAKLEGQIISNQFAPDYWSARIGQANRSNTGKSGGSGKSNKGGGGKGKQPSYRIIRDRRGRIKRIEETTYNEQGEKVVTTKDSRGNVIDSKTSGKGAVPTSKK